MSTSPSREVISMGSSSFVPASLESNAYKFEGGDRVDTPIVEKSSELMQITARQQEQGRNSLEERRVVPVAPHDVNDEESSLGAFIKTGFSGVMRFLSNLKTPQLAPKAVNTSLLTGRLNPQIYEDALKILNLSVEAANNPVVVDEAHAHLVDVLGQRQTRASPVIAHEIGILISDIQIAYRTITEQRSKS